MNDSTPAISRHLNILGCLSILAAASFIAVFFNIEDMHGSVYFIGGSFTFLIISVLSFGFSKIIELLDKMSK
jgi:hypothetical protein